MKWISVKESLPLHEGPYLTLNSDGCEMENIYMIRKYYPKKKEFTSDVATKYITHWLIMPEPPK